MIYGYARVSTSGQYLYGTSMDTQEQQLRSAGATVIYKDAFTGTEEHRPQLDKLLDELQPGDTIVFTKLDRVARSVRAGLNLIDTLLEKGVVIEILNMGKFDSTPAGKLMRTVFFGFAEFERDMIVQRTQEGKAIARQKPGYREGRKPVEYDSELFESLYSDVLLGALSVTDAAERLGVSRAKWYRIVKERDAA